MAKPGESEGSQNGMVFAYLPALSTGESVWGQLAQIDLSDDSNRPREFDQLFGVLPPDNSPAF
jgi:hypothetical protein